MKRKILSILVVLGLMLGMMVLPAQAASSADIEDAVARGLQALVDMQQPDGSWHAGEWSNSHPKATTCLALVKLQERAYELGYPSPFDPGYEYSDDIIEGWQFVLQSAKITKVSPLPVQFAGNPDENGNGYGLDVSRPMPVERYGYTNGICLMALASTGTPSRPNDGGLDFGGAPGADTYLELAQDVAEHLAYGQVDAGPRQGGWHYTECNNGPSCNADNSVTGYAVLGLAYAEAFGVALPAFVKPEHDLWVNYIQSADGGSGYNSPGTSNLLRTGNLIFEMSFVDGAAAPATARFQSALAYIEEHWRDANKNPGWGYSLVPADYQAMYTLMKGLEYSGIDLIDTEGGGGARDDDWFNQEPSATPAQDFANVLIEQQDDVSGLFPGDCHTYGDPALCQIWALLILEKVAPPSPVLYPTDDSYTDERIPYRNYGKANTLWAYSTHNKGGHFDRYMWLKFNVEGVNPATLTSATLTLHTVISSGVPRSCDRVFGAHLGEDDAWDELTIKWMNQPLPFVAAPEDTVTNPRNFSEIEFDVTDIVRGQAEGDDILTVVIKSEDMCLTDYLSAYSRENADELKPYIEIE